MHIPFFLYGCLSVTFVFLKFCFSFLVFFESWGCLLFVLVSHFNVQFDSPFFFFLVKIFFSVTKFCDYFPYLYYYLRGFSFLDQIFFFWVPKYPYIPRFKYRQN